MGRIYSFKQSPVSPAEPPSDVATALLSWLKHKAPNTQRAYRGIVSDWSRSLGAELMEGKAGKLWKKATHSHAQRWLLEVASRPAQAGRSAQNHDHVSDATLRHKAIVMSAAYDELIASGLCEVNPFIRLCKEYQGARSGERRPHELVDYEAVKRLLSPPDLGSLPTNRPEFALARKELVRNHALLCLLFGAALRRSEAAKLRIGDVHSTSQGTTWLHLRDTKSGHDQEHTVADWIASALKALVTQRKKEGATEADYLLVCYEQSGTPSHTGMSDSTLYRLFKTLCAAEGLPASITPHCARVTAITRLLDQGLSHRDVKEFSRHSSVVMVERYDRRRKSIDEAIAKKIRYD